jgi:hypothetical protein
VAFLSSKKINRNRHTGIAFGGAGEVSHTTNHMIVFYKDRKERKKDSDNPREGEEKNQNNDYTIVVCLITSFIYRYNSSKQSKIDNKE